MKSPLNYAGGKTRARKILADHMPKDVKEMSSIFCGGLSFELYCENELGIKVNKAYDFNPLVINLYNFIKIPKNAEKLVDEITKEAGQGKGYNFEAYKRHWNAFKEFAKKLKKGEQLDADEFQLAIDFYVTHNFSRFVAPPYNYSGFNDQERLFKGKLKKILDFKTNMIFECSHFKDSIPKHNSEFLYLDPPYYKDGKNLKSNLYFGHDGFDHNLLAELIKNHKGHFLMSYNDCEFVREAYKDFNIKEVAWKYSMASGMSKESKKDKDHNKSYEVIISDYEWPTQNNLMAV